MDIIGLCRFSFLGRGDWAAYRRAGAATVDGIVAAQAKTLFEPARLSARLASLEHVTLASMQAQAFSGFRFVVLASDAMPAGFQDRLRGVCAGFPFVILEFLPVMAVTEAQQAVFDRHGIELARTVQFRLDDDDALSANYTARLQHFARQLLRTRGPFAVSFTEVMCADVATGQGHLLRLPFLGVGAALHHPRASIFQFGHFGLQRRFPALTLPDCRALVSRHDHNDSRFSPAGTQHYEAERMGEYLGAHFPFLSPEGLACLGQPPRHSAGTAGPAAAVVPGPA